MKLWFIEPRANVFVSGVKDSVADSVVKYLMESCSVSSGLLILQRYHHCPGFKIWSLGETKRRITSITGLQLIVEKSGEINIH